MRTLLIVMLTCLAGPGLWSCREAPKEVTILAAASLQDVVDEARQAYYKGHGLEISASYGGSSTLARQIAEGATADLFLSADVAWAEWLRERRATSAAPEVLAKNALVVVAPKEHPFAWTAGEPLADAFAGRLALAEPSHVPAGKYAKAALEKLGAWEALAPRVVSTADVRAALRLVSLGEADAGVVYATDALEAEGTVVVVARLAPELHEAVRYTALLLDTDARERAAGFLAFLRGPEGQAIFARHGFLPP
ncbi:MAG: molybdate ABC transporter substrate-binding protein [Myxococcales bacterium]|nr:molybdate ABC transporter substrate-binding protein [Myxococcales bacterium]MCB9731438.1 molybdate ABC transporter substrate-binding protein [Deltaproteobacteria bacterium]